MYGESYPFTEAESIALEIAAIQQAPSSAPSEILNTHLRSSLGEESRAHASNRRKGTLPKSYPKLKAKPDRPLSAKHHFSPSTGTLHQSLSASQAPYKSGQADSPAPPLGYSLASLLLQNFPDPLQHEASASQRSKGPKSLR
jgi:hypothetical protein